MQPLYPDPKCVWEAKNNLKWPGLVLCLHVRNIVDPQKVQENIKKKKTEYVMWDHIVTIVFYDLLCNGLKKDWSVCGANLCSSAFVICNCHCRIAGCKL